MASPGPETELRDLARLRWLWRGYGRRYLGLLLLALLLMAVEGSVLGGVSLLMEPMFDRVFVEGSTAALWIVGGGLFALFTLRAFTASAQRVLMTYIGQRVAANMRQDILGHAMTLDGGFHATHPPGYMIERVQGDTGVVVSNARAIVTGLGRDVIGLVVLFSVAISVDPVWTAVALIGIPLLFAPAIAIQSFIRKRSTAAREAAARMALRLDEVFHGISTVKLSRLERYQADRYRSANDSFIRSETESELGRAMIPGLIDVFTGLGILGVLAYGGGEIVSGEKTVGQFMSFFTAIALAFEPVRRLGNLSGVSKTLAASLERIQAILDTRPALLVPAQPKPIAAGDIRFEDVHVRFGETRALEGLSFTARAGEVTALVGASGAGKSTVFHTLTRLAPLTGGCVTMQGTDITETEPGALRGLISIVSQDALLFDDTLRENITFGAEISDETLRETLEAAHVADFLPALPAGLESPAGPRGSNLSGGQRQRISIARALLKDAPVLLLDEATSALDAESEHKVQEALARLSSGRTTLVIAHRLSTIRDADRIVVMDRGRAVEEGTHGELLAREGVYARLHALQFREEA
ncbi:MAG: ABC transporter ATP-binding protein [Pseudomonadota bacterium]